MAKYGFLGMGIMGKAMAANLLKAGNEVMVWNRTLERCKELIDQGAHQGQSPAQVVADCQITFAMVSDPAASEDLCFGKQGVLEGISAGKAYIDVSTVDPDLARRIGTAISAKGGRYLEAPVSGSKKPAEDGQLVFLCSGDKTLYEDAQPAFDIMGKKSFYFAELGQAAEMKLVINMIMGSMMVAFAEGLTLGNGAGLQADDILAVLSQGAIDNPMFRLKGPQMLEGNFAPAFPLKHMQKDMRLALAMGDNQSQALNVAAAANNAFLKARKLNLADNDFCSVLKAVQDK